MSYVCGSCGHRLKKLSSTMGFCPKCGRDSLVEKDIKEKTEEEMEREDEVR
jgi:DNA-directed RNA polymerase subunit RPC12/RpoP